jgi:hypothetical protein
MTNPTPSLTTLQAARISGPLRLGTRRSALAMTQSRSVAEAITAATGRAVELVEGPVPVRPDSREPVPPDETALTAVSTLSDDKHPERAS